jgi:hypothetical protein
VEGRDKIVVHLGVVVEPFLEIVRAQILRDFTSLTYKQVNSTLTMHHHYYK